MQLVILLMLLAALSVREVVPNEPIQHAGFCLLATLAAVVAAPLAAKRFCQSQCGANAQARKLGLAAWVVFMLTTIFGVGWGQLVLENWRLRHVAVVGDLLLLAPVIASLVGLWSVWLTESRTHSAESGSLADLAKSPEIWQSIRFYLLLPLIPALAISGADHVADYLWPDGDNGAPWWLVMPGALAATVLGLPWLLRLIWPMRPIEDSPLKTRLDEVAARAGVGLRGIWIWNTRRTMVNAAVIGLVPGFRYVLFTDALWSRFSEDEIVAVFAHELGHLKQKHLWLRVVALVLPLGLWLTWKYFFPGSVEQVEASLEAWGMTRPWQLALFLPVLAGTYAVTVFAHLSRTLEHDADLAACQVVDPAGRLTSDGVDQFVATLEKLGRMTGEEGSRKSWLHPSIPERIAFLRRRLQRAA